MHCTHLGTRGRLLRISDEITSDVRTCSKFTTLVLLELRVQDFTFCDSLHTTGTGYMLDVRDLTDRESRAVSGICARCGVQRTPRRRRAPRRSTVDDGRRTRHATQHAREPLATECESSTPEIPLCIFASLNIHHQRSVGRTSSSEWGSHLLVVLAERARALGAAPSC